LKLTQDRFLFTTRRRTATIFTLFESVRGSLTGAALGYFLRSFLIRLLDRHV
jgi:hypothetical protein